MEKQVQKKLASQFYAINNSNHGRKSPHIQELNSIFAKLNDRDSPITLNELVQLKSFFGKVLQSRIKSNVQNVLDDQAQELAELEEKLPTLSYDKQSVQSIHIAERRQYHAFIKAKHGVENKLQKEVLMKLLKIKALTSRASESLYSWEKPRST